ncbi:MAG: hypothetical protein EU530_09640 [Promethearchaeota archaeon]|nr:MAG: hypothetical protein EU530_09640 [Candidatus Lokiarchaeota archaeon]
MDSKIPRTEDLFVLFTHHLTEKGYKQSTINRHLNIIEFLFDYLEEFEEIHPLEVTAEFIEYFVGNFHIRKVQGTKPRQLMNILASYGKFYQLMRELGYIDENLYEKIMAECKNRTKYRDRYESYHAIDNADDWMEWVM